MPRPWNSQKQELGRQNRASLADCLCRHLVADLYIRLLTNDAQRYQASDLKGDYDHRLSLISFMKKISKSIPSMYSKHSWGRGSGHYLNKCSIKKKN